MVCPFVHPKPAHVLILVEQAVSTEPFVRSLEGLCSIQNHAKELNRGSLIGLGPIRGKFDQNHCLTPYLPDCSVEPIHGRHCSDEQGQACGYLDNDEESIHRLCRRNAEDMKAVRTKSKDNTTDE